MIQNEIIKINRYNAQKLPKYIAAFLLLKTGSALTPSSIAQGLMTYFNVQTSHVSVTKYLKELVRDDASKDEAEENKPFVKLNREYIKPHYRKKDKENEILDFGSMYYLVDNFAFDGIYNDLLEFYQKKFKSILQKNQLKKRLLVFQDLKDIFECVSGGVLVYYYNDNRSEMVRKKALPIDFVVLNGTQKKLILATAQSWIFPKIEANERQLYKQALFSIQKLEDVQVYILNLMDKDINNPELVGELTANGIVIVHHQDIRNII